MIFPLPNEDEGQKMTMSNAIKKTPTEIETVAEIASRLAPGFADEL